MYVNKLIKYRKTPIIKKVMHRVLLNKGIDIPNSVIIGNNVSFPHNSIGTVIHDNTIIKDNVKIYQNVTIGRSDIWKKESKIEKIIIEEGAIICAGAKVLCKKGTLVIGKNSIVGANAVLTHSIGENEIWAGIPAKFIRKRD